MALLAGCGGESDDPPPPTPSPPSQSSTNLEITVWPSGRSGDQHEATLRCSPTGGSLPDPDAACERLEALDRPFARPPDDAVCTEIYGGPAEAEVTGTFDGSQVNASFSRTDGCEIGLWDRHQFLFPVQPEGP